MALAPKLIAFAATLSATVVLITLTVPQIQTSSVFTWMPSSAELPPLRTESPVNAAPSRQLSPASVKFVHIPKTAGTSLTQSLKSLAEHVSFDFDNCGVSEPSMKRCLAMHEEDTGRTILSGEFAGPSFQSVLAKASVEQVWTFLRNPILRSLSQVEHFKRQLKKPDSWPKSEHLLSRERCALEAKSICPHLANRHKCDAGGYSSPCGLFQSNMVRVLGRDDESPPVTAALRGSDSGSSVDVGRNMEMAIRRVEEGVLSVGITEHYRASVCLLLHENWYGEKEYDAFTSLWGACCTDGSAEACPLLKKANVHHDKSFYVTEYLSDEASQAEVLQSNAEDCRLYETALPIFLRRVRDMEAQRGVHILKADIDEAWTCESWLAKLVASTR